MLINYWLDGVLLAILFAALVWGFRKGILGGASLPVGVLFGWWLAASYSDDLSRLAIVIGLAHSAISSAIFLGVIVLATVLIVKIGEWLHEKLFLGLPLVIGPRDKLGGMFLGLMAAVSLSAVVLITVARLGFDFVIETPPYRTAEPGPGIVAVENQRQALVDSLQGSRGRRYFMAVREFLPDEFMGLARNDFDVALDLLERNIDRESNATRGNDP